jgi:hydroxypyruvate isomerase
MKQSFVPDMFGSPDEPLADLVAEAARIGYAGIDVWDPGRPGAEGSVEEIVDIARSAGLEVASFVGQSGAGGLTDPDHWERIEHQLVESIDRAAALGVRGVLCFPGDRVPGVSDAEAIARFIQGSRRITPHAEARGVDLEIEILNSRVDHPGYLADTVDWALAACEGTGSPRMRILFDVYHVQIMEGDLIRGMRRIGDRLAHVQTAGNPGRHELDDDQEINYRALGRELGRLGFDGFVGHELTPLGDRHAALRSAYAAMLPVGAG